MTFDNIQESVLYDDLCFFKEHFADINKMKKLVSYDVLSFCIKNDYVKSFDYLISNLDNVKNYDFNCLFFEIVKLKKINFLKLVIKNEYLDPSYHGNFLISTLLEAVQSSRIPKKIYIIRELLFKDIRVKNSLKKDNPKLYEKLLKIELKNTIKSF